MKFGVNMSWFLSLGMQGSLKAPPDHLRSAAQGSELLKDLYFFKGKAPSLWSCQ